jgi:hypothetical protein
MEHPGERGPGNISKKILFVLLWLLMGSFPVPAQTAGTESLIPILFMTFSGVNTEEALKLGSAMQTNLEYALQGSGYRLQPSPNTLPTAIPTGDMLSREDLMHNPRYLINGILTRKDAVTVVDVTLWDLKAEHPTLFFAQTFGYERFEDALTIVPFYSGSLILPLLETAFEELSGEHEAVLAELESLRRILLQEQPSPLSGRAEEPADEPGPAPPPAEPASGPAALPPAPPPPKPAEEEAFVFSPSVILSGGFQVFFPGPQGVFSEAVRLQNEYYPIGLASFTGIISQSLGFIVAVERDSITMNRFLTRASWDIGFVGIEAGPYIGLFNPDPSHVSIGVSLLLRLGIPQRGVFSSFRLDTPVVRDLSEPGDHYQSFNQINLGYGSSVFRIVLSMTTRGSSLENTQGITVTNRWIRYNLDLEIAPSRIPLKFRLNGGYQELRWTYNIPLSPFEYRYEDVFAGIGLSYTKSSWTFFLGLEAPVYPFRYEDLLGNLQDPQVPFFAQFTLGLQWTPRHRELFRNNLHLF